LAECPHCIVVPPPVVTDDETPMMEAEIESRRETEVACQECGETIAYQTDYLEVSLSGDDSGDELDQYDFNPVVPKPIPEEELLLQTSVAEALIDGGFTGATVVKARVVPPSYRYVKTPVARDVATLRVEDPVAVELALVGDHAEDNACPYCGHGPIWCPHCACFKMCCDKCRREIKKYRRIEDAPRRVRGFIDHEFDRQQELPYQGAIDIRKWNGVDVVRWEHGAQIVTRRVVEWLREHRIGPILAWPLECYVGGVTSQHQEWIERALGGKPIIESWIK